MTVLQITVDPVLGAIIIAILGGVGWFVKWLAGRIPEPLDSAALDAKMDRIEARHDMEIGAMKDELAEERARGRLRDDYIESLRVWISDGKPPPPPPWPEGLRR